MTDDNTPEKTHHVFIATLTFFEPVSAPFRILAKDEAHARELIPQLFANARDLKILDLVQENAIEILNGPVEEDTSRSVH